MSENSKYHTITRSLTVKPESEPVFSELATEIRIEDEAAGEFIEIIQHGRTDIGKICISADEWPEIKSAVEQMMETISDFREK